MQIELRFGPTIDILTTRPTKQIYLNPHMNQTAKSILKRLATGIANLCFLFRGLRLPAYFDPSDRIYLIFHNIEPDVINAARLYLKPGMVVIDIGANVGLMTRVFARAVGVKGRVIAFEPDPLTLEYLRFNVRSLPQVEISTSAVSNENTVSKLHLNPRSGTSNSLIVNKAAVDTVDVICETLDSYLQRRNDLVPNLIKIDVEGAECRVFSGMTETLARYPDLLILVEFCPENLSNASCSTADFYDILKECCLEAAVLQKSGFPKSVTTHDELLLAMGSEKYVNLLCKRKTKG